MTASQWFSVVDVSQWVVVVVIVWNEQGFCFYAIPSYGFLCRYKFWQIQKSKNKFDEHWKNDRANICLLMAER